MELEVKSKKLSDNCGGDLFKDCGDLGFGIDSEDLDEEEGDNGHDDNVSGAVEEEGEFVEKGNGEKVIPRKAKVKKVSRGRRLGLLGAQVMDLRDVMGRREEKRREHDFNREKRTLKSEEKRGESELIRETLRNEREERMENWEMELEEREVIWGRKELEIHSRLEKELDDKRKKRRRMEENMEEEEMEWREIMMVMQVEHEKAMIQIHADACQNQMQILGLIARLMCQFFGANDALGGGLWGIPPQVLQNWQHPGGLGDNGKPDVNSPSEFL